MQLYIEGHDLEFDLGNIFVQSKRPTSFGLWLCKGHNSVNHQKSSQNSPWWFAEWWQKSSAEGAFQQSTLCILASAAKYLKLRETGDTKHDYSTSNYCNQCTLRTLEQLAVLGRIRLYLEGIA